MNKYLKIACLVVVFMTSCAPITTNTITSTLTPFPVSSMTPEYNNSNWYRYSSSTLGISFSIPKEWRVEDTETGITIASDLALQVEDNLSFEEGDVIIWIKLTSQEYDGPIDESTMIDMLINLPPYLPPGKEPPHMIQVNGKRIAFAGYGINRPVPYPSFTAILPLDGKTILGLIFTSVTNERSFREVFQKIISSIESN
jgi:hypothetical protein